MLPLGAILFFGIFYEIFYCSVSIVLNVNFSGNSRTLVSPPYVSSN